MRIVVDTCVWSLALARHAPSDAPAVAKLRRLIEDGEEILLPGVVLQELLQGLRSEASATRLRGVLEPFELVAGDAEDFARAATIFRACRAKGAGVATIDALIAAITIGRQAVLLTTDVDFRRLAEVVPLKLLAVPA